MKAKNKQPRHRNWECLIILLLAVVAVPAVLFSVWVGLLAFCYIPTEISRSEAFIQFVLQHDYSEAEPVQLVYDEISRELAWLGTSELGYVYFRDICQSNTCAVDSLYIDIVMERFPIFYICTWFEMKQHVTITFDIDISKSQVDAEIYEVQMWAAPARDRISSEITQVRDHVLHAIDDDLWKMYPTLVLKFSRGLAGWGIRVYTTHGTLIHEEKVDYSDISE